MVEMMERACALTGKFRSKGTGNLLYDPGADCFTSPPGRTTGDLLQHDEKLFRLVAEICSNLALAEGDEDVLDR